MFDLGVFKPFGTVLIEGSRTGLSKEQIQTTAPAARQQEKTVRIPSVFVGICPCCWELDWRPCILLKCAMFAKQNKNDSDKVGGCVKGMLSAPNSQ